MKATLIAIEENEGKRLLDWKAERGSTVEKEMHLWDTFYCSSDNLQFETWAPNQIAKCFHFPFRPTKLSSCICSLQDEMEQLSAPDSAASVPVVIFKTISIHNIYVYIRIYSIYWYEHVCIFIFLHLADIAANSWTSSEWAASLNHAERFL